MDAGRDDLLSLAADTAAVQRYECGRSAIKGDPVMIFGCICVFLNHPPSVDTQSLQDMHASKNAASSRPLPNGWFCEWLGKLASQPKKS
jgi:hypothetical protein